MSFSHNLKQARDKLRHNLQDRGIYDPLRKIIKDIEIELGEIAKKIEKHKKVILKILIIVVIISIISFGIIGLSELVKEGREKQQPEVRKMKEWQDLKQAIKEGKKTMITPSLL